MTRDQWTGAGVTADARTVEDAGPAGLGGPAPSSPGSTDASGPGDAAHRLERFREGVTAALHISLGLLAVMVALPPDVTPSASDSPAAVVAFAGAGLVAANLLAFRLSTRLAHGGQLEPEDLELAAAQLVGGLAVVGVAVAPVLLVDGPRGVFVSELVLLGFVAVVGYTAVRAAPVSRGRAVLYTVVLVALTLGVIGIKNLAGH